MRRTYLILLLFCLFSCNAEKILAIDSEDFSGFPLQLTNIPTFYITTVDSLEVTSKELYVKCRIEVIDNNSYLIYDSVNIRGRGNGSWTLMPKKSYRIKFPQKTKLLGDKYANAKNWTLLANCCDKLMVRNALTRELGLFCGMVFNPTAKFVDLYINGGCQGTYQISDHIDVRKKRVDIEEQDDILTDESNITGGYFLEVTTTKAIQAQEADKPWFFSDKGVGVIIKYPEKEVIHDSQKSYIQSFINEFESRLFSEDFSNLET